MSCSLGATTKNVIAATFPGLAASTLCPQGAKTGQSSLEQLGACFFSSVYSAFKDPKCLGIFWIQFLSQSIFKIQDMSSQGAQTNTRQEQTLALKLASMALTVKTLLFKLLLKIPIFPRNGFLSPSCKQVPGRLTSVTGQIRLCFSESY